MRGDRRVGETVEEGKNKIIARFKNKKQFLIIICGAILGVFLLLFSSGQKKAETKVSSNDDTGVISYEQHLEEKIRKLCESVDGVSNVRAMVTLEGGFEHVYAKDGDYLTVGSGSSRSFVQLGDKTPTVRGIGIVCRGARDPVLQKELIELLSAALDLPANRIFIANGK